MAGWKRQGQTARLADLALHLYSPSVVSMIFSVKATTNSMTEYLVAEIPKRPRCSSNQKELEVGLHLILTWQLSDRSTQLFKKTLLTDSLRQDLCYLWCCASCLLSNSLRLDLVGIKKSFHFDCPHFSLTLDLFPMYQWPTMQLSPDRLSINKSPALTQRECVNNT